MSSGTHLIVLWSFFGGHFPLNAKRQWYIGHQINLPWGQIFIEQVTIRKQRKGISLRCRGIHQRPWFLIIPFTFKVFTSKRIFHCIKPGRAPVITRLGNSFFWCTYQFTKHKIAISEGLIVQKRGVRTRDEALKMSAWKAKQPQESSSLLRGGLFMSSGDWGEGKIKACGGVFGGSKVSLFCR